MDTLERQAQELGNNRARLLKRLLDAKSLLKKEYRKEFKKYKLDFENKRLLDSSRQYALQWQIRPAPNEPISYLNQQTSTGFVYLTRIKAAP